MAPIVLGLMYIMGIVAWPTAKLLDYLLGEDHGTVYKKGGLKTLVSLHQSLGLEHERHRQAWRARMDSVLSRHDVIMTPTLARPPVAADGWRQRGWLANLIANLTYTPYCGPVNFARLPAVAVPAGVHPDGTPTSVHFIGRGGSEAALLSLAAEVEQLHPWLRYPRANSL